MAQAKRYVLRLFISLKYGWNRQSGRVVMTASSVEKPLRDGLECGRTCNAKVASAVGEVLAMRLGVDGLARELIHSNGDKEVKKKGFKNRTKVWATSTRSAPTASTSALMMTATIGGMSD